MLVGAARVFVACLPMAAWGILSQVWWDVLTVRGTASKVALLCVEVAVAAALFAGTAAALRCEEFGWARDLLRGRQTGETECDASS